MQIFTHYLGPSRQGQGWKNQSRHTYLLDISIHAIGEEASRLRATVDDVEDLCRGAAEGNGVLIHRNKVGTASRSHNALQGNKKKLKCCLLAGAKLANQRNPHGLLK